ncbi:MAG: hypothetical protein JSR52_07820 [Planctomycetes bacterium]|nr:hypothetical protein [Planctomycetota bacterium]
MPATPLMPAVPALDVRIMRTGDELMEGLSKVLRYVPGNDAGPQRLADELGVDTVLASRLLKAVRSPDSMSLIHRAPGPEPLRRVLKASAKHGVPPDVLAAAHQAVDAFENLIDSAAGDRSSLEAILSAWVPEARREFELRRKQAAFRAISQLKGVQANVFAETAIFTPSADGQHCDVVWIKAVAGLSRLRPAAVVKFTSKRGVESPNQRLPVTLSGEPIDSVQNAVVPEFCTSPTPALTAQVVGEQTHYLLENVQLGDSVQLMTCEVNHSEIARYVPASRGRRAWASSDLVIPAQRFQFDLIVHQDLFPGEHPDLRVYDTAVRGTADRNDPARDIDQFDLLESVEHLGSGLARFASSDVPRYRQMLEHILTRIGCDASALRGYRVASDYPIYGSQYTMSFRTTDPPAN